MMSSPLRSNRWVPQLKLMTESPDAPWQVREWEATVRDCLPTPRPMKLSSVK